MGCDIHLYMEHVSFLTREGLPYWSPFGGRTNPGWDYEMFERLAGVRGDERKALVPPRGLPVGKLGYMAESDWWLHITDGPEAKGEDVVTRAQAEDYARHVPKGEEPYKLDHEGLQRWVRHPDWHTPSWLTAAEYGAAVASVQCGPGYRAVAAALGAFVDAGQEARVVFWFDN